MYLDVEFENGQVTHIPLSRSHTVRVVTPADETQDAFSLDGVKSVTLNLDGAPLATQPASVNVGAAEGATADPSSGDAGSEPSVTSVADTSESGSPQPADGNPSDATVAAAPVEDQAHDHAVAAIQETVTAAADPATPEDVKANALAKAQEDLGFALGMWPDSTVLADLKTQLDTLNA